MDIRIYSPTRGEIPLVDLPMEAESEVLFFGAKKKTTNSNGNGPTIIIQEYQEEGYTIRHYAIKSSTKETLTIACDTTLFLRIACDNTHRFQVQCLGNITIHQRGYNWFYVPISLLEYTIERQDWFIFLDIIPSFNYLTDFKTNHSKFAEFISRVENKLPSKLCSTNQIAQIEMLRWVDKIYDFGKNNNRSIQNLDQIIFNTILQSIKQIKANPVLRNLRLTPQEINTIYSIADALMESGTPINLSVLSNKFGLTKNKISKGFRHLYGYPIAHHRYEERMRVAINLIEEKLSSKQVSNIVGYKNTQDFSRAYKKRFGNPPFRKK